MTVLSTITYYTPYVSGLTIAAARWAEGLVSRGHTVTVLAMRDRPDLPETETINGVRIERARILAAISKGFLSVDWIIRMFRLVRTSDVTVINLPQFEGALAACAAKILGKRVIAVYHCEINLPRTAVREIVQSLLEVSNMMTLLFADRIVTYTRDYDAHSRLLRAIRRFRPGISVDTVVPPIPMPGRNEGVSRAVRKARGNASAVIGVAARLAAEKGVEYLIRAIPDIERGIGKNFRILIAGPESPVGEQDYLRRIRALLDTYGNRVTFTGSVPAKHMGSFYRAVDVLVLPSVNSTEAFGMVQVEAMLCGVPVVATDLPGVRVPVGETGMGIVVPPRNPRAIARAVIRILTDPAQFKKPVTAVSKRFSDRESIDRFDRLLT